MEKRMTNKKVVLIIVYIFTLMLPIYGQPYKLVLYDEFNGTSLNNSIWSNTFDWGPVLKNGETLEYFLSSNVEVDNSVLKLYFREQPAVYDEWHFVNCNPCNSGCLSGASTCINPSWNPNTCFCIVPKYYKYTSGMIFSNQKFGYGKFEISCKVGASEFLNYAFWIYGGCGEEIDIFEFLDNDLDNIKMSIHQELDCNDRKHVQSGVGCEGKIDDDLSKDFHTYTLEWTPYEISWGVDGIIRRKCRNCCDFGEHDQCSGRGNNKSDIPSDPHPIFPVLQDKNVIISCGVDNAVAGSNELDITLPVFMEIDYIKIWQLEDLNTPPYCNPTDLESKNFKNKTIDENDVTHAKFNIITEGNVLIKKDVNVTWTAGDYIELNDGFETEEGAVFVAEQQDCIYVEDFSTECFQNFAHGKTGSAIEMNADSTNNDSGTFNNNVFTNTTNYNKDYLNQNQFFYISPNPNSGIFQLSVQSDKNLSCNITITNLLSQIVFKQINIDYLKPVIIDISVQPKGIYFMKVRSEEEDKNLFVQKIILQ